MQNALMKQTISKIHCFNSLYRQIRRHKGNHQQWFNHYQMSSSFGTLSRRGLHQLKREYKAVQALLIRSGLYDTSSTNGLCHCRYFSSGVPNKCNANQESKKNSNNGKNKYDKDKEMVKVNKFITMNMVLLFFLSSFLMYMYMSSTIQDLETSRFISWNEFEHEMLAKGEVKELIVMPDHDLVNIVLHPGAIIKGRKTVSNVYFMMLPNVSQIDEKIREAEKRLGINPEFGVRIVYERPGFKMFELIFLLAIVGMFFMLLSGSAVKGKMPQNLLSQFTRAKFTLVDPLTGVGKGVRFSDVAGLQEAKTEVMEFVDYLKTPERYNILGAKIPKGALLLGPPGCGKTLLAKAVATEANVPFLSMNGPEFIEMVGGLGAARVRDLFKEAKKRAPSIIYIDEIDTIGKKRAESSIHGGNSEREQTLNQLLTEMDGMVSNNEVIVMASTNRAEVLDKALLRPGRFDRHILIDLPTLIERKQIFEQHLKGITLEHAPSSYSTRLAHLSPGFSGADIANVCNEAALHAARLKKTKVTGDDLLYALDRVIAGIEKRDNTVAPSERRIVAHHEAGHALVGWLLEHTDALIKVTIVPRTNRILGFAQSATSDQKLYTREQLFQRMCMLLGGRVAESLVFNKITTGAQDDLEKVTKIAYAQVQQYGMDEVVGPLSFHPGQLDTETRKPYSKTMARLMDEEARRLVAQAYKATEKLMLDNLDKLKLLAEELLKKETLTFEEIEKLIGPPPFGRKKLIEPVVFENTEPVPPPPESETPPPQPLPA